MRLPFFEVVSRARVNTATESRTRTFLNVYCYSFLLAFESDGAYLSSGVDQHFLADIRKAVIFDFTAIDKLIG